MSNNISGKYKIVNNIDKNISTKTYTYTLEKNNYDFFSDAMIVKIVSAEVLPQYIDTKISAYYNSVYNQQTLRDMFNWSDNINDRIIKINNTKYANINISSTIADFKDLNGTDLTISAYTLDTNNELLLLSTYSTTISSFCPRFTKTKNIYYPYRLSSLMLNDYIYFQDNILFGDYLNNAKILDTTINEYPYEKIQLIGETNNNSKLIFTKANDLQESKEICLPYTYTFNYIYDENRGTSCWLYPVNTKFTNSTIIVRDNNYDTFISAILSSNNLSCYNCTLSNISIQNLSNNLYIIDHDGNMEQLPLQDIQKSLISSNYFKVTFDTIASTSIFYNKNFSQLINNHTLNCLYLHNYYITNNKTFYLPALDDINITYILPLTTYILNKGYNDIFDFNILDENNKNINNNYITITNDIKSETKSNIPASINISTYIKNDKFILPKQYVTYNILPLLWKIDNTGYVSSYNQIGSKYYIYDLLSANYCIDKDNNLYPYNRIQNINLYLSSFLSGTNIDKNVDITNNIITVKDDPLYIHNFKNLVSFPIIQNVYSNNKVGNPKILNFSLIGKYINRIQNKNIYVYYDNETKNKYFNMADKFTINATMLSSNYRPKDFEEQNIILKLSDKISLTDQIKDKLSKTFLSKYIQGQYLYIYTYSILSNIIKTITPTNLSYYNIIDNIYIYIPTYIIGSIKSSYNCNNDKIYKLNNQFVTNINPITYCFDFSTNLNLSYNNNINCATLNIQDFQISTSLNFYPILFENTQYIEFQDRKTFINSEETEHNSYNIYNISNCINNYNIYFNKDNPSALYYDTVNGIITKYTINTYGGIIYTNTSTQFIYKNQMYIDLSSNLDKLYTAHIPNISAQLITTYISGSEISGYYKNQYPELLRDYYRSTVNSSSEIVTSGIYKNNLFNTKSKKMYTSINNLINNIPSSQYIVTGMLSCYYYYNSLNNTDTFKFTCVSGDIISSYYNTYINLYFEMQNTNNFGIFTLFIHN